MFFAVFSKPVACCVFLFDNATVNDKYNCIKQLGRMYSKSLFLVDFELFFF